MDMDDFRKNFKDFDDACLIDASEYGQLMGGISTSAVLQKRFLGELAEPAIQGGKVLRWRAGDVRQWLKDLRKDTRPDPAAPQRRTGRPRKVIGANGTQA